MEGEETRWAPTPGFLSRDPTPLPHHPAWCVRSWSLGGGSSGSLVPCPFVSCLSLEDKDGGGGGPGGEEGQGYCFLLHGLGISSFLMVGDVATPPIWVR